MVDEGQFDIPAGIPVDDCWWTFACRPDITVEELSVSLAAKVWVMTSAGALVVTTLGTLVLALPRPAVMMAVV